MRTYSLIFNSNNVRHALSIESGGEDVYEVKDEIYEPEADEETAEAPAESTSETTTEATTPGEGQNEPVKESDDSGDNQVSSAGTTDEAAVGVTATEPAQE